MHINYLYKQFTILNLGKYDIYKRKCVMLHLVKYEEMYLEIRYFTKCLLMRIFGQIIALYVNQYQSTFFKLFIKYS